MLYAMGASRLAPVPAHATSHGMTHGPSHLALDQLAALEHVDAVCILDRRESVCDDHHCAPCTHWHAPGTHKVGAG